MKLTHLAARMTACALASTLIGGSAWGRASATLELSDGTGLSLSESGFEYQLAPVEVTIAPLQTLTWTLDYTITLADDGLPTTRDWQYQWSAYGDSGGPGETGFEQAAAIVDLIWPRYVGSQNYALEVTGDASPPSLTLSTPGFLRHSGSFSVTALNTSTQFDQVLSFEVLSKVFLDASPIPEPSAAALLLAGLALFAIRSTGRGERRCLPHPRN